MKSWQALSTAVAGSFNMIVAPIVSAVLVSALLAYSGGLAAQLINRLF